MGCFCLHRNLGQPKTLRALAQLYPAQVNAVHLDCKHFDPQPITVGAGATTNNAARPSVVRSYRCVLKSSRVDLKFIMRVIAHIYHTRAALHAAIPASSNGTLSASVERSGASAWEAAAGPLDESSHMNRPSLGLQAPITTQSLQGSTPL